MVQVKGSDGGGRNRDREKENEKGKEEDYREKRTVGEDK